MFYLTDIRRKWVFILGFDRLLLLYLFEFKLFRFILENRTELCFILVITLIFYVFMNKFIKNSKILSNWNVSLIFQCNYIQKIFSYCDILIATNFLGTNYRRKARYWCTYCSTNQFIIFTKLRIVESNISSSLLYFKIKLLS